MTPRAALTLGVALAFALSIPVASASHDPHTRERWCDAGEVGCTAGRNYDGFAASAVPDPFGTSLQNWLCGGSLEQPCTLAEKVDAASYEVTDAGHRYPSEYARFAGLLAATAYARGDEAAAFACAAGAPCLALP